MNIFVLDLRPHMAAQYHNDKHVVKMCLETAQILSTVQRLHGNRDERLYKPTHQNHPCVRWAGRNTVNYRWTRALFFWLLREYTHRYGKRHKCSELLPVVLHAPPTLLLRDSASQSYDVESFVLAMPDDCKDYDSAVQSYRNYYIACKQPLAQWTNRPVPEWWQYGD